MKIKYLVMMMLMASISLYQISSAQASDIKKSDKQRLDNLVAFIHECLESKGNIAAIGKKIVCIIEIKVGV